MYTRDVYSFIHALNCAYIISLSAFGCSFLPANSRNMDGWEESWQDEKLDGWIFRWTNQSTIEGQGLGMSITELGKVPLVIIGGVWLCLGWILSAGSGKEEGRCGQSIFGGNSCASMQCMQLQILECGHLFARVLKSLQQTWLGLC